MNKQNLITITYIGLIIILLIVLLFPELSYKSAYRASLSDFCNYQVKHEESIKEKYIDEFKKEYIIKNCKNTKDSIEKCKLLSESAVDKYKDSNNIGYVSCLKKNKSDIVESKYKEIYNNLIY